MKNRVARSLRCVSFVLYTCIWSEISTAEELDCPLPIAGQTSISPGDQVVADLSDCFVTAGSITASSLRDYTVIDMRHQDQINADPVSGALAIRSHSLQDKSFLKHHRLLLLGDAFDRKELFGLCQTLRKEGFEDVHVLANGIAAIHVVYGEALANLLEVNSEAFMSAYKSGLVRPVFLDDATRSGMEAVGVKGNRFSMNDAPSGVLHMLEQSEGAEGLIPVVLMGQAEQFEPLESGRVGAAVSGVYVMKNPVAQFEKLTSDREQVRRVKESRITGERCGAG